MIKCEKFQGIINVLYNTVAVCFQCLNTNALYIYAPILFLI